MRLMLEGFYVSDYVDLVLNYIEQGTTSSESVWYSKEKLIRQFGYYDVTKQMIVITEIREFLIKKFGDSFPSYLLTLLSQTTDNLIKQRAIELLKGFDTEVIRICEEEYDYIFDIEITINYINKGIDLSVSYYKSKENFFEKLTRYSTVMQQSFIREIKSNYEKKVTRTYFGYLLSFLKEIPREPFEQRTTELLGIFDPQLLALVNDELGTEKLEQSTRRGYFQ